jgi:enolase
MNVTITGLTGREILDSRGRPTVEAEVTLSNGIRALASVPSGASTGSHEAVERRDGDPGRYGGMGVRGAVSSITTEIADVMKGSVVDFRAADEALLALDGTADKSRLGANAVLAVSLVVARAQAKLAARPLWQVLGEGVEPVLPLPMVNIISGGLHAGRQLDFQDFLIVPVGAPTYSTALEWSANIHRSMGDILAGLGLSTLRADEGGYGPALSSHEEALNLLDQAVERAGLQLGDDVVYAIDVAATHFFDPATGGYVLNSEGRTTVTGSELIDFIADLATRHPIASVEDALAEDD